MWLGKKERRGGEGEKKWSGRATYFLQDASTTSLFPNWQQLTRTPVFSSLCRIQDDVKIADHEITRRWKREFRSQRRRIAFFLSPRFSFSLPFFFFFLFFFVSALVLYHRIANKCSSFHGVKMKRLEQWSKDGNLQANSWTLFLSFFLSLSRFLFERYSFSFGWIGWVMAESVLIGNFFPLLSEKWRDSELLNTFYITSYEAFDSVK